MKTVETLFEDQDPQALALMKEILKRPALYFGTNRLDPLYNFMDGYTYERKNGFCMMPDELMQHWLLHTQMAALHSGSMQASSLFWRYFGACDTAIESYKCFLDYPLPETMSEYSVSFDLYSFKDEHDLVRYDWEDDISAGFYDDMARSLVADIEGLICNAGFTFDELRVYVRRELLFTQVRFLFHGADGWRDDSEIIARGEIHGTLVGIMAKAQSCKSDALAGVGCEVFEQTDFSNSWENDEITDLVYRITNEKTFLSQYLGWRAGVFPKTKGG